MYNLSGFGLIGIECPVHGTIPSPAAFGGRCRVMDEVDGSVMLLNLVAIAGRGNHVFLLKEKSKSSFQYYICFSIQFFQQELKI